MGCPCGAPGGLLGPALLAAAVVQVFVECCVRSYTRGVYFLGGSWGFGGPRPPFLGFFFLVFLGRPPGIRSHAQVKTYLEK